MSSGFISGLGGAAGSAYAQRHAADADRASTDAAGAARGRQSQQAAESAAGIGETHEESGAEDRDADGRRLWERTGTNQQGQEEESQDASSRPPDPDELLGGSIDVAG